MNMNALLLGALGCVLLFLAVGSGLEVLFRLAYTAFGTLLLAFLWSFVGLRGVRLRRQAKATRSQVGSELVETITLANDSVLPKPWVTLLDDSTLPDHQVSRVVSLGARKAVTWSIVTNCRERGIFRLGPAVLRVGDPFGLFERRLPVADATTVVVYPATTPLPGLFFGGGSLIGGVNRRERTDQVTTNAAGVREYAPGDAFSRIHWRSTARAGYLMVKEFEPDPIADVWIALDMHSAVHTGRAPSNTEEYAVHAAASLARHYLAAGWAVGLLSRAEQHHDLPPERGDRQMTKILEELAVVHANGPVGLGELLISEGVRLGRQAMVVAITPSTDLVWAGALRAMTERGIRCLVVMIDASSFGGEAPSEELLGALALAGIPVCLYRRGDNLADVFVEGAAGSIV